MFLPEFHTDLSRYKEMRLHCIPYKKNILFAVILRPLAQGAQASTREIWVRITYACKILSEFVKICLSYTGKSDT